MTPDNTAPTDHAALVARPAAGTLSFWRKQAREIDLTVEVPRANVSETELEAVVTHIRRTLGQMGVISHVGGSLNWLTNSRTRKVYVSLVTRDGRTTIQAQEKLAALAGVVYGVGVWGVGVFGIGWTAGIIALNTLHSTPIAVGLWGTLVAASWGAAHAVYRRLAARRQRQLGSLIEEIGAGLASGTLMPELGGTAEKRGPGSAGRGPEAATN